MFRPSLSLRLLRRCTPHVPRVGSSAAASLLTLSFGPRVLPVASRACATQAGPTSDSQPSPSSSPLSSTSGDMLHITRSLVWGLWNEGNLYSLSVAELAFFLREHCHIDDGVLQGRKKSALVRHVEEVLSADVSADLTVAEGGPLNLGGYDRVEEALEDADDYGDWGAAPGFNQQRRVDYMELNPRRLGESYDPLVPRSFQLLHSQCTSDVKMATLNASRLPGFSRCAEPVYTVAKADIDEANRSRFRRAFEWCLVNIWNMNIPGELNIGAGKALYYRQVSRQRRSVLPIWAMQKHIYGVHPYAWFAIATEDNRVAMGELAEQLGMQLVQDATTSYRLSVRRLADLYDLELNDQLQCIKVNRPWDRLLVSHYVREAIPDLRYVVRARHPIKKRVADAYMESDVLRHTRDSVQSVLSPELGDVLYCCERSIRKWAVQAPRTGVTLQLVETTRTPLIITKAGDEGRRLEYEWIVQLPQKAERVDVAALSDELWDYGNQLAQRLEQGMKAMNVTPISTAVAY